MSQKNFSSVHRMRKRQHPIWKCSLALLATVSCSKTTQPYGMDGPKTSPVSATTEQQAPETGLLLHEAIDEAANPRSLQHLEALLKKPETKVTQKNGDGNNPLMYALTRVMQAKPDQREVPQKVVSSLLKHPDIEIDAQNDSKVAPIDLVLDLFWELIEQQRVLDKFVVTGREFSQAQREDPENEPQIDFPQLLKEWTGEDSSASFVIDCLDGLLHHPKNTLSPEEYLKIIDDKVKQQAPEKIKAWLRVSRSRWATPPPPPTRHS